MPRCLPSPARSPAPTGRGPASSACVAIPPMASADLLGAEIAAAQLPRLTAQTARIRKGKETKLVLTDGGISERDNALVMLLREAMATRAEVLSDPTRRISQLAASTGRCSKRISRLVRLSWIAPEIVDAILAGRQPHKMTTRSLLSAELPITWAGQKVALGF